MKKKVHEDSLRYIVCQIRQKEIHSIEGFKRTASVLNTYNQFSTLDTEPLVDGFIRDNKKLSQDNLSTKQILEDIMEGEDISSLMEVNSIDGHQKYNWSTRHYEHEDLLNTLRELGNSIYMKIDEPFNLTSEYEEMRGIARTRYESPRDMRKFKFWEGVVAIDPSEIIDSTPLVLAREIFSYVRNDPSRDNILQGVKAIKYINQENPDPELAWIVGNFATYFIDNLPEEIVKPAKILRTLRTIAEMYKRLVQVAV